MKKNKGITLVSLVIYVIVMIFVIAIMSRIITNFYNNTNELQADTKDLVEYNKFNTYFLKEIKTENNSIDTIGENGEYILFSTGNSFYFSNGNIYFNNTSICKNVSTMEINANENDKGEYEDIVSIRIVIGDFDKTIKYKIESVY